MESVKQFLSSNKIKYIIHSHPAVFTCQEADIHCHHIPGIASKNLFLRNNTGNRYFLIILPATKKIDLKVLSLLINQKKISFASPEKLNKNLGVSSGSVSIFGLLNDKDNKVETYIDEDIYSANIVGFHPNINTATVELSKKMFHHLCQILISKGHSINTIKL